MGRLKAANCDRQENLSYLRLALNPDMCVDRAAALVVCNPAVDMLWRLK